MKYNYLLILILALFLSCNKKDDSKPVVVASTLSVQSFIPSSGVTGDTITISGSGFGTDSLRLWVDFNGSRVRPKEITDTKLKVLVPEQAKTGKIKVSFGDNLNALSALEFTKLISATIKSFSPLSARIGDVITIKGTNFGLDTNVVSVKFGASKVYKPKIITDTTMSVNVPIDAETAKISLSINGRTALISNETFTLLSIPVLTSFSPTSARSGEIITITGTGFGIDTNRVNIKFGNSKTIKPKTITDKSMTVVVPSDAETAKISLSVNNSAFVSSVTNFTLIPKPTISSFSPQSARAGETVIISGTGFGTDINAVNIKFGNSSLVKPETISTTRITVFVPLTAQTGKISIIMSGVTIFSNDDFTLKPTLSITNFSPLSAGLGDTLTINGTGFGTDINDANVFFYFKTKSVKPFQISPTQMKVIVPNTEGKGTIDVSIGGSNSNSVTSTELFTFIKPIDVSSISVQSARVGEIIDIIVGLGVTELDLQNINAFSIKFNGANSVKPLSILPAFQYVSTQWRLRTRIPAGAKDGIIEVGKTGSKSGLSKSSFTILPPMPEPQIGAWTQRSSLNMDADMGSIAFTIGNKAYVGIGERFTPFDGLIRSSAIWEYDPVYNAWMQKAAFAGGGRAYAVSFTIGNKGYIGTGESANDMNTNDLWEYDAVANNWLQKANFPGASRSYAVGFSIGNKGYIGSGSSNSSTHYDDFYQYEPIENKWTKIASIVGSRSEAYAFVADNKAYVGNGYSGVNNTRITDMYMYDPNTNQWTAKANFPSIVNAGNSVFVVNNKGYVGSGYTSRQAGLQTGTNKFYEYSPVTNSWGAIPDIPVTLLRAPAFSINNIGYVGLGTSFAGGSVSSEFYAYKPQ